MKIDEATLVRARCNVFLNEMMEHSGASEKNNHAAIPRYILGDSLRPRRHLLHRAQTRRKDMPLAFVIRQAQHLLMTPATRRAKPTDLRAAKAIERNPSFIESTAEVIDRETGVRELVEMLENVIAEAGDLIESRSPELVAHARATLRHFSDQALRQAE
jgi:hypothetical protein